MPDEPGAGRTPEAWWRRHASLFTLSLLAIGLAVGAVVFVLHAYSSESAGDGHPLSTDVLYFGTLATFGIVLAVGLLIRQWQGGHED